MATLSYIGLSYYEVNANKKFINVLFQASTANNTYEYGFSDSTEVPPFTVTPVPNISTSLPADRPISAKLPYTDGSVVWIRNNNTGLIIWQTFNISDYSLSSTNNNITNYIDNIVTKTTTWGKYDPQQQVPITSGTLNTNIFYTTNALTINISNNTSYSGVNPLYIMSQQQMNVTAIHNNSNIIIFGIDVSINNATLTNNGQGILELTGTTNVNSGAGILIADVINYSGAISLTGTVNTDNGFGIYINGATLKQTGLGTLDLTGTATASGGKGLFIIGITNYSGAITLTGTANAANGYGILIEQATLNKNDSGTLALTGTATASEGKGLFITGVTNYSGAIALKGNLISFFNAYLNIYFLSPTDYGRLIVEAGSTITGTFNFGIAPTSNLQGQSVYSNIMTNIPSSAIANRNTANNTIEGTFGTDPNLIPWTASVNTNNWTLTTAGACLLEGTLIHTPSGYVLIEHINKGDEVITADNRIVKVISTYHSIMRSDTELYVIKQHSVDVNSPSQDLYVSSGHLVKIHDKYMHPIHLKSPLIEKCDGMRELSFYHLELENFKTDFLRANNLEVESYRNDNIHHTKWDCSGDECIMLL